MANPAKLVHGAYPGQVPVVRATSWVGTGTMTGSQALGVALRVPPTCAIHLASDSTLKMYPVGNPLTGEKVRGKAVTVSHLVRNANWNIDFTESIVSGATLQEISERLGTMSTSVIEALGCTIVVCMINAKSGQNRLSTEEVSGLGSHLIDLCHKLLKHKRDALIFGGSAELWGFDDNWDDMVRKAVLMCRASGIPTIDGTHYFRQMELQPQGWHVAKTDANAAKW